MKLLIAGGNMATNNVMQIRVIPSPTATPATLRAARTLSAPHTASLKPRPPAKARIRASQA